MICPIIITRITLDPSGAEKRRAVWSGNLDRRAHGAIVVDGCYLAVGRVPLANGDTLVTTWEQSPC